MVHRWMYKLDFLRSILCVYLKETTLCSCGSALFFNQSFYGAVDRKVLFWGSPLSDSMVRSGNWDRSHAADSERRTVVV